MSFSIRQVTVADAGAIAALMNPILEAKVYSIMTGPLSAEVQAEFILSLPARAIYLAAVSDLTGEVLGLQDVLPESTEEPALLHIGTISTFVAAGAQRKGVGRALSQASFREARQRGYKKICAVIRVDNPGAVSFYSSLGFETVGIAKSHAFVDGEYVDEILMERLLT